MRYFGSKRKKEKRMRSLLLSASCAAALAAAQPAQAGCLMLIGTSAEITAYQKGLIASAKPGENKAIRKLMDSSRAFHMLENQIDDPHVLMSILATLQTRCGKQ
jgi:hypothetical protein